MTEINRGSEINSLERTIDVLNAGSALHVTHLKPEQKISMASKKVFGAIIAPTVPGYKEQKYRCCDQ